MQKTTQQSLFERLEFCRVKSEFNFARGRGMFLLIYSYRSMVDSHLLGSNHKNVLGPP